MRRGRSTIRIVTTKMRSVSGLGQVHAVTSPLFQQKTVLNCKLRTFNAQLQDEHQDRRH